MSGCRASGRKANGIAHDFNNALAQIVSSIELLLLKPEVFDDSQRVRIYLGMIYPPAKDCAKAVSRLRKLYQFRRFRAALAPVVINDLILEVISLTQLRWKDQALAAGVNIEIRNEAGRVPSIPGDEGELKEVLIHLLSNAIDSIAKRGTITISTEVQGRWLVVTVTDNGVGMTEEVKGRCLESFFTLQNATANSGRGSGMERVCGVVRRHDGDIDIQSEPGRGTSVAISLPLNREEPAPDAQKPSPSDVRSLRVLIVDDEPLVREVLTVYLNEDSHEIVTAANGREGLEKFRQERFDLVLTDRAMPEMNGDELAIEIQKLRPEQKVILLSGYGDLMSAEAEKPPGVDLIVGKPFTLTGLRIAIAKVIEQ